MDSERDGCHGTQAAIFIIRLVNVYKVRLNVYKIKRQAHPYRKVLKDGNLANGPQVSRTLQNNFVTHFSNFHHFSINYTNRLALH